MHKKRLLSLATKKVSLNKALRNYSSCMIKNNKKSIRHQNQTTFVVLYSPTPINSAQFYARASGLFGKKEKPTTTTTVIDEPQVVNSPLAPNETQRDNYPSYMPQDTSALSSHEQHPATSEKGLARYMNKVNAWTAGGVVGSLAIATVASAVTLTSPVLMWGSLIVGFGASIFSIIQLNRTQPTYTNERDIETGEMIRVSHNTPTRKGYYYGLIGGNGLALSAFVGTVAAISPLILPKALILSLGVFAACAFISRRSKDTTMQALGIPLAAGFIILIAVQLSALGANMFLGPNLFSAMAWKFDTYIGLAIFTVSAIYSNWLAKRSYLDGKPDHLLMAASLYIDFINVLIRIMSILGGTRD